MNVIAVQFHGLITYYELTCAKNSGDPDQLIWIYIVLNMVTYISCSYCFLKSFRAVSGKQSSLCIICSLEQVQFSLDKYSTTFFRHLLGQVSSFAIYQLPLILTALFHVA